jgi:hypothetical protein
MFFPIFFAVVSALLAIICFLVAGAYTETGEARKCEWASPLVVRILFLCLFVMSVVSAEDTYEQGRTAPAVDRLSVGEKYALLTEAVDDGDKQYFLVKISNGDIFGVWFNPKEPPPKNGAVCRVDGKIVFVPIVVENPPHPAIEKPAASPVKK